MNFLSYFSCCSSSAFFHQRLTSLLASQHLFLHLSQMKSPWKQKMVMCLPGCGGLWQQEAQTATVTQIPRNPHLEDLLEHKRHRRLEVHPGVSSDGAKLCVSRNIQELPVLFVWSYQHICQRSVLSWAMGLISPTVSISSIQSEAAQPGWGFLMVKELKVWPRLPKTRLTTRQSSSNEFLLKMWKLSKNPDRSISWRYVGNS